MDDHSDHQCKFVRKAASEAREKLVKQLDVVNNTKATILRAIEEVRSAKSKVEAKGQAVTLCIESSFEDLYQVIEGCKRNLLVRESDREVGPALRSREECVCCLRGGADSCGIHPAVSGALCQRRDRVHARQTPGSTGQGDNGARHKVS